MAIVFEDHEMVKMARTARVIAAGGGRYLRTYLPADARMVWDDCDMAFEDWGDAEASTFGLLWALCELLRGHESPAWGNTGGRYGHSGGWFDEDEWEAIDAFDEDYEQDELSHGHWFVVLAANRIIQQGNLRAVIQMADILDMASSIMRANARC